MTLFDHFLSLFHAQPRVRMDVISPKNPSTRVDPAPSQTPPLQVMPPVHPQMQASAGIGNLQNQREQVPGPVYRSLDYLVDSNIPPNNFRGALPPKMVNVPWSQFPVPYEESLKPHRR